MRSREYRSPEAFRAAVEQRIRKTVTGGEINRFRQLLVYDRFLVRIFRHFGDRAVLKGGLVLELRLARARTTKDVDLRFVGEASDVLAALRLAGALDCADWLSFQVRPDTDIPRIAGQGMVYTGFRFRAQALLGGKVFGDPFAVDIGFADVLTVEPDVIEGNKFLAFAGIETASFRVYPRQAHIAEKLHAYTLPRDRSNTRVKDLPDLALLASTGELEGHELLRAIEATFSFRATHPVPTSLPEPAADWRPVYERMARDDELPWNDLTAVYGAAASFLNPVLGGSVGTWEARTQPHPLRADDWSRHPPLR